MNRLEHVNTLSGLGKVIDGTSTFQAQYNIEVYQQWVDTSSFEGESWAPGMKQLEASIDVFPSAMMLEPGKDYTLRLADGRQFVFWIQRMNPAGSHCTIVLRNAEGI